MQFQVPQYLDIKDKVIGPFTLKQFIVLLIGGVILFILFEILKTAVFILVAIPVALITVLIAFYRVNHQSFGQMILNVFGFITKPNVYAWKKKRPKTPEQEPIPQIIKKAEPEKSESAEKAPKANELEEVQWKTGL